MTFASLTVRPLFLSLIETYVCGLEPWAIRPALKAIILALLPGLEEETSDDYEPTLRLINKFRDISSKMDTQRPGADANSSSQYFWQCLFLASITSPSRRSGVLAYLNRYLPKLGITDRRPSKSDISEPTEMPQDMLAAVDSVVLPEPGLLIRCFASGLLDEQVLVQRNFLDLLVTHLPLSSPILQSRITEKDLQRLIMAAVGVVARRDMSLNRRLWSWFLGPEPPSDPVSFEGQNATAERAASFVPNGQSISQSEYFSRFGLQPLVNGLLQLIEQETNIPSEKTKPFRISLALMDRWEVGGHIVPAVFLPTIRCVAAFETTGTKSQFDEVFRSASAFFDGVESGVIFSQLLDLIDWPSSDVIQDNDRVLTNLKLAHFILENFNVREEDMIMTHVPLLTLSVLLKMREISSDGHQNLPTDQIRLVLNGLSKVINSLTGLLTERAFIKKSSEKSGSQSNSELSNLDTLKRIHKFYEQSKNSLDLPPLPFTPKQLGELIIKHAHELALAALSDADGTTPVQEKVNLLIVLLKKLPKSRVLRDRRLYRAICSRIKTDQAQSTTASFSATSTIVSAVKSLYSIYTPGFYISYEEICDIIPTLVKHLWQFLSPVSPKFHVEAVRCLWQLHSVSWVDHVVEAAITSLMIDPLSAGPRQLASEEQIGRYFVLWNHSHHGTYEMPPKNMHAQTLSQASYQSTMLERPLFIVLDLLSQGPSEAFQVVQRWLQDLPSIDKSVSSAKYVQRLANHSAESFA